MYNELKKRGYLYIFCLVLLALTSCKNNDDAPGITYNSNINVVNLVPDAGSINYYANGTRQNSYKLGYTLQSGYLPVPSQQTVAIKDTLYNTLYTAPYTFKADSSYTLLVTGQALKQTVTIIALSDAVSSVVNVAEARFVHASPNTPALDVFFNNVSFSNRAYKSVSGFSKVDTGKVTIKVNLAGTNTTLINTKQQLSTGGVYTIYVYGLSGTSGAQAFNIGGIINH